MERTDQIEAIRRTCRGIAILYRARKAGLESIEDEINRLNSEYREITHQKLREKNDLEKRRLTSLQTENRREQSRLVAEKLKKQNQLTEIENDFQLNQCESVRGTLR